MAADNRVLIEAKHADAARRLLELDPREEAAFWPVYEEYRADLTKKSDGLARLIRQYAGNSDHLTDDQAERLLERFLELKEERIQLHYQYVGRFRKF
jgi:hypothetical protein